MIVSDFLDDLDETFNAMYRFCHRGFEILLLQVLVVGLLADLVVRVTKPPQTVPPGDVVEDVA